MVFIIGSWFWRRAGQRALLRAMSANKSASLPGHTHPDTVALAQAYHRLRAKAREEVKIIDSQRNELSALLTAMTDAVVALDRNETILNLNQSARQFFDAKDKDLVGKEFHELSRNPELLQIITEILTGGVPVSREITISEKVGVRSVLVNGTPYDSPAHKQGVVLVLRDVTRLRQLEEHRREFVANVSHELKTPITSIKGYAETLLDGAIDEPDTARKFTEVMARQSNRLSALVEDLLQLSRLEQLDELELLPRRVHAVIESAVASCAPIIRKRSSLVRVHGDHELLAPIHAESLEIGIRNLIENAVKYSPPGSEVSITLSSEGGHARIAVKDNGPGIAPEHQSRLFERFYRVDKSRSSALGGTGLGLAIVKHIAQAHRGTVRLHSITGHGCTFTIEWPL